MLRRTPLSVFVDLLRGGDGRRSLRLFRSGRRSRGRTWLAGCGRWWRWRRSDDRARGARVGVGRVGRHEDGPAGVDAVEVGKASAVGLDAGTVEIEDFPPSQRI